MSESDTSILRRAKGHAGKAFGGLSAAAIVFLYANFATTSQVQREIDREHQRCIEAQAKHWRDMMDMLQTMRFTSTAKTNLVAGQ